jgi:hypothetical protein
MPHNGYDNGKDKMKSQSLVVASKAVGATLVP